MYKPLVSIIIPVYNGSNFLKEAIESALGQTYDNLEIIVVNDGSQDNGLSEKIALSYGNKIKYLTKENGGVSSALNFALEKSNGTWFSWLSHDDLYFPNKISREIEFINELLEYHETIDLERIAIHSATVSIDVNGRIIKKPSYRDVDIIEDSKKIIIDNIYNYRLSGCSFLVPKSAFYSVGRFREDLRTVSDVEYWYRLLFNDFSFICLKDDILVKNRSHGTQVGKSKETLFNKELNDLFIEIFEHYLIKFSPKKREIAKFYFGLVKRKLREPAKHIKLNYLKKSMSFFEYHVVLPFLSLKWIIAGTTRNIVKKIFRIIFVKNKN